MSFRRGSDNYHSFGNEYGSNTTSIDYYELLGVPRNASPEMIKRAYKKLALRHHPDRGGNAELFKRINEAYNVLINPEERRQYDAFGEDGIHVDRGFDSTSEFFDLFSPFGDAFFTEPFSRFGDFGFEPDPDFMFSRRKRTRGPSKPDDIIQSLPCSLEDLYNGKSLSSRITRRVICKQCGGRSLKRNRSVCRLCKNQGQTKETRNWEIVVRPGSKTGTQIRLRGAGDETLGCYVGDVVYVIKEKEHPFYKRNGVDLCCEFHVSLAEALCGFNRCIETLDHRKLMIHCTSVELKNRESYHYIADEGMPYPNDYQRKGKLYVKWIVDFPTSIDSATVITLQQVFQISPPKDSETPSVQLENADWSMFGHTGPDSVLQEEESKSSEEEDPPQEECHVF